MDKRVTVNVPDSPPDEHDGEDLHMAIDERGNLVVTVRASHDRTKENWELLAIYAHGFWADARIEDLEV
jgi:hypothetical protein